MPRQTKPLTDTEAKNAKARDKVYYLFDGGGLALRVTPTASKQWLFNYRHPLTKSRTTIGFGGYPSVSLANARSQKQQAKALLSQNIDPQAQRRKEQREALEEQASTVGTVAQQWLENWQAGKNPATVKKAKSRLERFVLPKLGKIPVNEMAAPLVVTTLKPLEIEGKLETRDRVFILLNQILSYALALDLIPYNPLAGLKKGNHIFKAKQTKNRPALSPKQLPTLVNTIESANIKPLTRLLMLWQLHTMVRPKEAAGTQWSEIDTDNALWCIPAERMKGGKRGHVVPLTTQTLAILEQAKALGYDSPYLFPSDRDSTKHANPETANTALKRMGFKDKQTAHGFRALASTTMNEAELNADHIEAALAHVHGDEVRKAYNRTSYVEQRRPLMAWWSNHIEGKTNINNVVMLGGGK